jgi:cbb3-type cytochrome oxidase maturation protein
MSVIFILIPLSLVLATLFLAGYIWAVRSGQYEDTCTPALRLLTEESGTEPAVKERFPQVGSRLEARPNSVTPSPAEGESEDRTISTPKPNHPR